MLKNILRDTQADLGRIHARYALSAAPHLAQAAQTLEERFGAGVLPKPRSDVLDALRTKVRKAIRNQRFDHITPREWRIMPELFWGDNPPLATHQPLLNAYAKSVEDAPTGRPLHRLISVLLREYKPDRPGIPFLSQLLIKQLKRHGHLPRLEPWQRSQSRLSLFSLPDIGPKQVAQAWLENGDVELTLRDAHLLPVHWSGGYVQDCYRLMLEELRWTLVQGTPQTAVLPQLESLLAWSVTQGALRFPTLKAELAAALLLPFQGTDHAQGPSQKTIQTFLLQHLGDPRLEPGRWLGVAEQAKAVLIRWLLGNTLQLFFQLLDGVAKVYHWAERKQFWSKYLRAGLIVDACVVLGPVAKIKADRIVARDCPYSILERGTDPLQCLLLLRLGNLVICEWSHEGACRIWEHGQARSPVLHQPRYSKQELIDNWSWLEKIPHQGYTWQEKIADTLAEHSVPRPI